MELEGIDALTEGELEALRAAAVWYANYHSREVAGLAGQEAAHAITRKERYFELVGALAKLGVSVRVPDALLAEHAAELAA